MQVLATAGHVDHGKSTLVRALTGQDPDRLAEEHRRGLSIELGYCWANFPAIGEVAFVDVPGHERFISTMLAGIGPVPAVLFVVAADDPWMPQAEEHLAALSSLGVRHGVVAVTRCDLANPADMIAFVRRRLESSPLEGSPVVPVSARTGEGLPALQAAIVAMIAALPAPDPTGAVRLWVDRVFTISGAGTVVTGTLPAGTIRVGDVLSTPDGSEARIRGIETLGRSTAEARGVSRVALRLGGSAPDKLSRGTPLFDPVRWQVSDEADVRLEGGAGELPDQPMLHLGAASFSVRVRRLADDLARIRLASEIPLHVGDRLLLRDPGSRRLWGATVLDPAAPRLQRRGAARDRAIALVSTTGVPSLADELRRRGVVHRDLLRRLGVGARDIEGPEVLRAGDWLIAADEAARLGIRLAESVARHAREHPLDPGLPVVSAARSLGLPTTEVLPLIVAAPLIIDEGRVVDQRASLPPDLRAAVSGLAEHLADKPFAAPEADRLAELGLDPRSIAAAARAGLLLRLAEQVVLLPGADDQAAELLSGLPQPFTTSQARARLDTTRRVAIPLLERLDRRRLTRRLPDDRREVIAGGERD